MKTFATSNFISTRIFILRNSMIIVLLLATMAVGMNAQQDFKYFNRTSGNASQVLKKAKKANKPVFVITSWTKAKWSSILLLEDVELVNWVLDEYIPVVYDWGKDARSVNKLLDMKFLKSNPFYGVVHPDGTVLNTSLRLENTEDINRFLIEGKNRFNQLEQLNAAYAGDKKNVDHIKPLLDFYLKIQDKRKAKKMTNTLLKRIKYEEAAEASYLLEVAQQCQCGSKLDKAILSNKRQLISKHGKEPYYQVRSRTIMTNLNDEGILEPFYVWQDYEKEFGEDADRLYRQFAIDYFSKIENDPEALLDEVYDYLAIYSRRPWTELDPYYNIAVNMTTKKADWEELQDLISYQIFRDKNYRTLDYRAMILFKMGEEERALMLMQEIAELGRQAGIKYKSMLHRLNK